MGVHRKGKTLLKIDRDPDDLTKMWGWIYVEDSLAEKFNLKQTAIKYKYKNRKTYSTRLKCLSSGQIIEKKHVYPRVVLSWIPKNGAKQKKFKIIVDGLSYAIWIQEVLTLKAILAWLKTWAPSNSEVITSGNRTISLDGDLLASSNSCYVYFILNSDSNAIKIGRAKDVEKRLKSLQTGSPAKLQLISKVRVASEKEAAKKEKLIHQQFKESRITGEWFRCSPELDDYIASVATSFNS